MSSRSSTGSAVKTRSILHYFKPKSATPVPAQPPKVQKKKGIVHATTAVVDVSSGEDCDDDDDAVQVLSEIRPNSPRKSGQKVVVCKSEASRSSTSSFLNDDDTIILPEVPPLPTHGRDSGSLLTDEDEAMDSQRSNPVEDMDLDMSEFLDVLVDEKTAADQEDDLMLAIAISAEQNSDETRNSSENDYKLTNFRNIIDFVLNERSYSHLLNSEDWEIVENITSASVAAQRLFIRLYLRQHKWIRSSHINYPEVTNEESLPQLLHQLVQKKLLIHCNTIPDLDEALSLLDVKELKSCAASLGVKGVGNSSSTSSVTRPALIDAILKHAHTNQSIKSHFSSRKFTVTDVVLNQVKKILGDTGYCIEEKAIRLFSRLTYLYYPPQVNEDENGVSISHEFYNQLKVTQGQMKYPEYRICRKEVIFRTRDDLVKYESACRLETLVLSAVAKKDHVLVSEKYFPIANKEFNDIFVHGVYRLDQQLPIYLRNQTAGHVFCRCLSHMVQAFEQSKQYDKAVSVLHNLIDQDTYCLTQKGKWFERLVIDSEKHLKKPDEALAAISRSMQDQAVTLYFRYNLYTKGKKATRSGKKIVSKFPIIPEFEFEKCKEKVIESATLHKPVQGRRTIFVADSMTENSVCLPVENVAMNHYIRDEGFSRGLHSESLIYHTLFNILLWKEIYLPLEDAFRTYHQTLPLDFVHEDFYIRRKECVDKRLQQIRRMSDTQIAAEIDTIWNKEFGTQCLISWNELQLEDVKELAFCMGADVLAAIFERLCSNFRFNRSGFPDLILWNSGEKRVKAVEVKGPGDSLSGKQILWLDYFRSCGLDAEVCYVKKAARIA